ncbi:glycoside hydrolase family 65 protein [Anditalea andensis]|uniref:Trehalose 6-phosphate phosphorylase n=1 Tax=Anditalea andensis TaxID=1048983 RepID=A0A074KYL2_9BACT|nr:glycosyl hydrolase family 65 protein [Anditalea andensis]KEO74039.1 trehalose 6-phosphate phosphorylase [Anditalea andensis]
MRFSITYNEWIPKEQKLRESLCTLGNGYIATRGAAEECVADKIHYPGTYLAGGFDRAVTKIADKDIENEDFVNFPNWLCLKFRPEGGEWIDLDQMIIHHFQQVLDMKKGLLIRSFTVEDKKGRKTSIKSSRLVSMREKHLAAIAWELTAENWSGKGEICSALDGRVINGGVPRYSDLESHHLEPKYTQEQKDNSILLVVETKQSNLVMAQACSTNVYLNGKEAPMQLNINQEKNYIEQMISFDLDEGHQYKVEKIVSIYSSRDRAITEPSHEACMAIERTGRFEEIAFRHFQAYERLWHKADIGIIDGDKNQLLIRLHIFHILQTVSLNTIGLDVGVPARGLHGEAYRGHIFWDELYIFPYLNLRFPEISRSLLKYRFFRLKEARYIASERGKNGALFPWQSGSNGREESQKMHLNPESGNWIPDNTHLQSHINSAIAYNIWHYYLATEDQHFLSFFGTEIFCSIACFWASMAEYNEAKERYEIKGVVGPDEYHTAYPGSENHGLDNNAYTNVMAAWVLQKAIVILDLIEKSRKRELLKELDISNTEIEKWKEISEKIYVPFLEDGIIAQFDGYDKLEEFPWEDYSKKYGDIHRLDRILEKEGDDVNKYKASKQADLLMLFYLFTPSDIKEIFQKLGYEFNDSMIYKNVQYYNERTSHGSTLSRLVFSWIQLRYDKEKSWQDFEQVLISDFEDIQGGTTAEGIHLGAMAGSLDLVQRGFLGIEVNDKALWINPDIPEHIKKITLRIKYRKHWISISANHHTLKISFEEGWSNMVHIGVIDKMYEFKQGEVREFSISSSSPVE